MKRIIILIIAISIFSTSCEKLVEGINVDPATPGDAPAITMLTGVLVANMAVQEGELARISGIWCGYFKGLQQQYQSFNQYIVTARIFDDNWARVYTSAYKNIKLLKEKAQAVNNIRLLGVAQVVEANVIGTATALWGDIPYSQAADERFPNPAYDKQSDIYKNLQLLLDEAIKNLNSTAFESFAAQDIHFAGNNTRWIALANTLKARYFMHTKEYDKALAAAANGIRAQADNWVAPHSTAGRASNNLYNQFVVQDRPGWMDGRDAHATNLLNPASTRSRGNTKTVERSRFNFLYTATFALNTSTTGFFGSAASFPLATFAENLLILAEADTRTNGFAAGLARLNAYRAYMNPGGYIGTSFVTAANCKYDPYVAADFDAGGMENPTATAIAPDRALLREILEERYITFVGSIEGFNDVRRTFKETDIRVTVPVNVTGASMPLRILYPQVEVDLNTSTPNPIPGLNVPTAVNN
jgi:starch-binding outer membrane protein, SusD/RagB family